MNEVDNMKGLATICKILKQNKKKSCGFDLAAEVMLEVMPEMMSAETALIM